MITKKICGTWSALHLEDAKRAATNAAAARASHDMDSVQWWGELSLRSLRCALQWHAEELSR